MRFFRSVVKQFYRLQNYPASGVNLDSFICRLYHDNRIIKADNRKEPMKNEIIESLLTRRSCRSYTSEPVSSRELETILNAGLYAASGMGKQSAVMVAVTNRELRDKLSKLNASVLGTSSDPFYGAPAVVAVLSDSNSHTFVEDGALVIGNLMLAATALGIASCWIHRAREIFSSADGKQLKREWGLSDSYEGVGFCILGHAAVQPDVPGPRRQGRIITIA
jgi:nitroreductase